MFSSHRLSVRLRIDTPLSFRQSGPGPAPLEIQPPRGAERPETASICPSAVVIPFNHCVMAFAGSPFLPPLILPCMTPSEASPLPKPSYVAVRLVRPPYPFDRPSDWEKHLKQLAHGRGRGGRRRRRPTEEGRGEPTLLCFFAAAADSISGSAARWRRGATTTTTTGNGGGSEGREEGRPEEEDNVLSHTKGHLRGRRARVFSRRPPSNWPLE